MVNKSHIHKIEMTPEQLEQFQTLLIERSGLVFEGRRVREMERSVSTRMIELGICSFAEYYDFLSSARKGEDELNRLVISLTVGETQFFRTPDQFASLRKYILPELLDRKSGEKSLVLVSAGCATGEEPYTLAILLRELLADFDSWKVDILGCDINADFLEHAREGIYSERKLRLVDPATRQKYFQRLSRNRWKVKDILQNDVKWLHYNITANDLAGLTENRKVHLFLCRNVLIYFNQETIQRVISNFYDCIENQGYLMLGYSESLFKINDSFQPVHTPEAFLYQKTSRQSAREKSIPSHAGPLERKELLQALGSLPHPRTAHQTNIDSIIRHLGRATPSPPGEASSTGKGKQEKSADLETRSKLSMPAPAAGVTKQEHKSCLSEDVIWKEALGHFREERFEKAGESFQDMLDRNPDSARARLGLGFIYANQGDEETAREYAETAVSLDDLMPETYFLIALLEERKGRPEEAIKSYQRVILLDQDFAMAHFNLAHLYLKLGRERDAAREFGNTVSILERDPDNFSMNFSGGLSGEAIISFCRMQSPSAPGPSATGTANRSRPG